MVIISTKVIKEYAETHPEYYNALERCHNITAASDWKNFAEMKKTINSVDGVGDSLFIFNIKGNDCRLVARIFFNVRTVFIRFIGTHSEYDKLNLKDL
ncbi:type II toxin-antitoxin system HigB family toxin [Albibacterium indicum]|uniref:type II toxin-antitoxin system HigB family toxin n=1 Tax=Albibacterium indicum TaxID=2292082 RepID=UPI000E54FE0F|nr:type II toxin-antitoxin system HigB family toxin [Pedobacter indicus]